MAFQIGQKVWDEYAGRAGIITSIVPGGFCFVEEGFGNVLCLNADLRDFETATTFRNGKRVRVADLDDNQVLCQG